MQNTLTPLEAISPIDGRYKNKTEELSPYLSEFGLIKYRLLVEINYLIFLKSIPLPQLIDLDSDILDRAKQYIENLTIEEAQKVKEIEKTTNHDVKAVEYYLKKLLKELGVKKHLEFVHFGLTSQDINNVAVPVSLKHAMDEVVVKQYNAVVHQLAELANEWKDIPMLARTHGQSASPTLLGKEIYVFVQRIKDQLQQLNTVPYRAKFGGATGNFNAHHLAYPTISWHDQADKFIQDYFNIERSYPTTQIESYDMLAALFHNLIRLNSILLDFSKDIWTYISMGYFKQKTVAGEIGSSAMPHKVNPIDFENAEGNLGMANAILSHMAEKLPISRLQRDLTDSTVLRNIGVPLGHIIIAMKSLQKGISKLELNQAVLEHDLNENWVVLAEAIQTILRRESVDQAYELLKQLTRGKGKLTKTKLHAFIQGLPVDDIIKREMYNLSPQTYVGPLFRTNNK